VCVYVYLLWWWDDDDDDGTHDENYDVCRAATH
jgi:hypothetical protein